MILTFWPFAYEKSLTSWIIEIKFPESVSIRSSIPSFFVTADPISDPIAEPTNPPTTVAISDPSSESDETFPTAPPTARPAAAPTSL